LHSKTFHHVGIPLLISGQLLRERQLGQVDLARIYKMSGEWVVDVAEVKSSDIGAEMLSRDQGRRLSNSVKFIGGLLGYKTKLIKLVG
jgi:hypothetical protein